VKEFFPEIDDSKGVSLVLVNNRKGEEFFKQIEDACYVRQSTVLDGAMYNANLLERTHKNGFRESVYSRIKEDGYRLVRNKQRHF
jgi:hypothetical protein